MVSISTIIATSLVKRSFLVRREAEEVYTINLSRPSVDPIRTKLNRNDHILDRRKRMASLQTE